MARTQQRSFIDTQLVREQMSPSDDDAFSADRACERLNRVLATEILSVLRYRHQQITASGLGAAEVAAEFAERAQNKEEHMFMLAERIEQLDGEADFNPSSMIEITELGAASHLRDMIRSDIAAESNVANEYRQTLIWFGEEDPTTRRLLEIILDDIDEHAGELVELLGEGQEGHGALN